jgi:hypothetical protein
VAGVSRPAIGPAIGYPAEPNELPETWQAFNEGPLSSPNLWTDAYLCAFANAARLTLVTFDKKIPTTVPSTWRKLLIAIRQL